MTDYKELITALREEAETVKAIEWEIPICTENHISAAADAIERLVKERDAAVEDLREATLGDRGECFACKHRNGTGCRAYSDGVCWEFWEWRGAKEAEHAAD